MRAGRCPFLYYEVEEDCKAMLLGTAYVEYYRCLIHGTVRQYGASVVREVPFNRTPLLLCERGPEGKHEPHELVAQERVAGRGGKKTIERRCSELRTEVEASCPA